MSAAADLLAALKAYSPLTDLVSGRIRFDMADERDPLPFVVLRQVGNEPIRGLDRTLHARRETFQIECWAAQRSQAATLQSVVEDALVAAELEPEAADPDAIDPDVGARAGVWNVEIWS